VTLPRSIRKIAYYLQRELGVPSENMEWHGHNDFHKVHINSVTAWLSGISAVNGAVLGIGERTGNSPIEALAIEYTSLTGSPNGMDLTAITEIVEYMKETGMFIPRNYPFAGDRFNVTMAGIHADGVLKNEEIYNIFDTQKVLNRPLGVSITNRSGIAGIGFCVNQELARRGLPPVDKRDPRVAKIFAWVEQQYEAGRITAMSPEELKEQFSVHFSEITS
jgi:isopropylmalate/homocitrate/citramalate synthase